MRFSIRVCGMMLAAALVASAGVGCEAPAAPPGAAEAPGTCEALRAQLDRETQEVRTCSRDAECGQVLRGTSCGCTRDQVARLDADLGRWSALREQLRDAGCEAGGISTCDCPPADGFACRQGLCAWNYLSGEGEGEGEGQGQGQGAPVELR